MHGQARTLHADKQGRNAFFSMQNDICAVAGSGTQRTSQGLFYRVSLLAFYRHVEATDGCHLWGPEDAPVGSPAFDPSHGTSRYEHVRSHYRRNMSCQECAGNWDLCRHPWATSKAKKIFRHRWWPRDPQLALRLTRACDQVAHTVGAKGLVDPEHEQSNIVKEMAAEAHKGVLEAMAPMGALPLTVLVWPSTFYGGIFGASTRPPVPMVGPRGMPSAYVRGLFDHESEKESNRFWRTLKVRDRALATATEMGCRPYDQRALDTIKQALVGTHARGGVQRHTHKEGERLWRSLLYQKERGYLWLPPH